MTGKISGDKQALQRMNDALAKVKGSSAKAQAKKIVAEAAAADGNRYLSVSEAESVFEAFDTAETSAGHLLGKADLVAVSATIEQEVATAQSALNLDGLTASFTSDKTDLEGEVVRGIQETVDAAQGRPVDIDVMIFQFQSKPIADQLIDIVQNNPNVHVRLIADFSQTSQSTQNQVPRLAKLAEGTKTTPGIPNLEIKYKKDDPYTWNSHLGRPGYSHTKTEGLLHHKGFVASIDGRPYKAMLGSFNWSKTANTSNYEDLIEVDATKNDATQALAQGYLDEFTAFFNDPDTLTSQQARAYKNQLFDEITADAKHQPKPAAQPLPPDGPMYAPVAAKTGFDLNSFSTSNIQALVQAVGASPAAKIQAELAANGRFASLDELYSRVPEAAALSSAAKAKLAAFSLGDGRVSVNVADADELMRAGFSASDADRVVAERQRGGDFQSLKDLADRVWGVSQREADKLADRLSLLADDGFYTSKAFSDPTGDTGYAPGHAAANLAVAGADGTVTTQAASVSNAVVDMFDRAKPGDTIRVSMYGISTNTPEFQSLLAANARGVNVKVLFNEGYNDPAAKMLKQLIDGGAQGLEARVQTAKTMHTKFGVVNDDVFTGSANFSTTAASVNSEDRFVLRNQPEMAAEYTLEFENVWAKSNPVK